MLGNRLAVGLWWDWLSGGEEAVFESGMGCVERWRREKACRVSGEFSLSGLWRGVLYAEVVIDGVGLRKALLIAVDLVGFRELRFWGLNMRYN